MTTAATETSLPTRSKYTVGTLRYTSAGLIAVFFWLLLGGFCFSLMEFVRPQIFPLYMLKMLGASNTSMYLMMTIIPNIFGVLVGPAVSFKSDRYRSRIGRRIPFLIWTTPIMVVALVGLGFSPLFQRFFESHGGLFVFSPVTATLLIIGFFTVLYAFMDEFINSVYWYLFADVVPEQFLGRFLALFRLVGAGAGSLFMWKIFPHAETHMHWIFLGIALMYLVGFMLMCFLVKEGDYPPPDDLGEKPSVFKQAKVYVTECFSHPIYILLFGFTMFTAAAMITQQGGMIIFTNQGLGLSLATIGGLAGIIKLVEMGLQFPSGWIVDKFHPLRMTLYMQVFVIPFQFVCFFILRDYTSFVGTEIARLLIYTLQGAAVIPMYMVIFPKDKFGQYCSCNGMMKSVAILLGGLAAGPFMDFVTKSNTDKFAYRWLFMWNGVFQILALLCVAGLYILWQRRGGDAGYVAPGSALEKQMQGRLDAQPSAEPAFPVMRDTQAAEPDA